MKNKFILILVISIMCTQMNVFAVGGVDNVLGDITITDGYGPVEPTEVPREIQILHRESFYAVIEAPYFTNYGGTGEYDITITSRDQNEVFKSETRVVPEGTYSGKIKEVIWIDSNGADGKVKWEDGVYNLTIKFKLKSYRGEETTHTSYKQFMILRDNPPLPKFENLGEVLQITYPQHRLTGMGLKGTDLIKSYIVNSSDETITDKTYVRISLEPGTIIQAFITDPNNNKSVATYEIKYNDVNNPDEPDKPDPEDNPIIEPGTPGDIFEDKPEAAKNTTLYVEETIVGVNVFVNTRDTADVALHEVAFKMFK